MTITNVDGRYKALYDMLNVIGDLSFELMREASENPDHKVWSKKVRGEFIETVESNDAPLREGCIAESVDKGGIRRDYSDVPQRWSVYAIQTVEELFENCCKRDNCYYGNYDR